MLLDVRLSKVATGCEEEAALLTAAALERRLASRSLSLPCRGADDKFDGQGRLPADWTCGKRNSLRFEAWLMGGLG